MNRMGWNKSSMMMTVYWLVLPAKGKVLLEFVGEPTAQEAREFAAEVMRVADEVERADITSSTEGENHDQ